jgi:hypothetical protein
MTRTLACNRRASAPEGMKARQFKVLIVVIGRRGAAASAGDGKFCRVNRCGKVSRHAVAERIGGAYSNDRPAILVVAR